MEYCEPQSERTLMSVLCTTRAVSCCLAYARQHGRTRSVRGSSILLHVYPAPQHVVSTYAACVASEALLAALRGRSMQDPAYELRRIPLPRTPVNRGKNEGPDAVRFTPNICVVRI